MNASSESPPPSSGSSPPAAGSPTAPRRSRRWVTPVVAVVVAAVVIVAVLFAAGVLFHKSSSPTSTEPYATLLEAESAAGSATSRAGSGWSPALAVGLRLGSSLTLPLSNLSALTDLTNGCNLTEVAGAPTSVTIDTTPAATAAGHYAFWLIGFLNGSGSILLVSVDLGVPAALYTLGGSGCAKYTNSLVAFPSSEVDSPTLVANANGSGGAAFLAANPGAAQIVAGIGGINIGIAISPPILEVVDTACPAPLLLNESEPEFNATLSGSGEVLAHSTGSVNCALGLGSLASGFTLVTGPLLGPSKAI